MSERVVRAINSASDHYIDPYRSEERPAQRGLISETALHLYVESVKTANELNVIVAQSGDDAMRKAMSHLQKLRMWRRDELEPLDEVEMSVAVELARRIKALFESLEVEEVEPFPKFAGCGWLSECVGDFFAETILFEMKAAARTYRTIDVRQLICYCALNFESKKRDIRSVCLFNPREGTFCAVNLEHLCQLASGRSSSDVFSELIQYASDVAVQY